MSFGGLAPENWSWVIILQVATTSCNGFSSVLCCFLVLKKCDKFVFSTITSRSKVLVVPKKP